MNFQFIHTVVCCCTNNGLQNANTSHIMKVKKGVYRRASITVRMDGNIKREFAAVCEELGMDKSTAITVFAQKVSREQRIPLEVSIGSCYKNIKRETE